MHMKKGIEKRVLWPGLKRFETSEWRNVKRSMRMWLGSVYWRVTKYQSAS